MNWFHGHKARFIFLYATGVVLLTGMTRLSSQLSASHQVSIQPIHGRLIPTEDMMIQIRASLPLLESSDSGARVQGAVLLGMFGPRAAMATFALGKALSDSDPSVRAVAARSLGRIGPGAASAIPSLIHLLEDKDAVVRLRAIEALGKMGPTASSAIPSLKMISKTAMDKEHAAVVVALERITSDAQTHRQPSVQCQEVTGRKQVQVP